MLVSFDLEVNSSICQMMYEVIGLDVQGHPSSSSPWCQSPCHVFLSCGSSLQLSVADMIGNMGEEGDVECWLEQTSWGF